MKRHRRRRTIRQPGTVVASQGMWLRVHTPPYGIETIYPREPGPPIVTAQDVEDALVRELYSYPQRVVLGANRGQMFSLHEGDFSGMGDDPFEGSNNHLLQLHGY